MRAQKIISENEELLEELEEVEEIDESPVIQKTNGVKSGRLPTILRLTRRANIFLFLTLVGSILFFITGNRQTFLDSNLIILLKIIACISISLTFFSFAAVVGNIFYLVTLKKLKLAIYLICYIVVFILSAAVSIISLSINLLSEGIDF